MRSKSRLWIGITAIVLLTTFAFADWAGYGLFGNAAESNDCDEILEDFYAGEDLALEEATELTDEEILQIAEELNAWKMPGALVMANVNDSVNVRTEPSEESEKAGKLYRDCGGYIIEYTDEWTKIESGNVIGWVSNRYLIFGDEAMIAADDVGGYQARVTTETLRVRKEPTIDSGVYGLIGEGDIYDVVEQTDDWLVIDFEGANGYISEDYVDISFHIDFGETIAEIEAREAAEAAAKAAAEAAAARQEANRYQNYGEYAASASDVELLGALIQCEAGNQSYEGQVAVGAVVMNRVRSGAYPNTIYGVIFASGQFTPARSGAVDRRIANGVSSQCLRAAEQALGGYSNVGSATHFRPTGNHDGIVIGGHVFW